MFQNMLMTSVTPLCNTNEIHQWENRPFANKWPRMKEQKSNKDSSITKTIRKKKRNRTSFTTEQIKLLENTFSRAKYINTERRKELAELLNIDEKCVKVWFQNRRMKEKRESEASGDSSSECLTEPITPPPEKGTHTVNEEYVVPFYYEAAIQNHAERYHYNPYVQNTEYVYPLTANYQKYDALNVNYSEPSFASEYFRNDNNIYPTHYYPYGAEYSYANLDENQSVRTNEEPIWSADMFDLKPFIITE